MAELGLVSARLETTKTSLSKALSQIQYVANKDALLKKANKELLELKNRLIRIESLKKEASQLRQKKTKQAVARSPRKPKQSPRNEVMPVWML